MGSSKLFSDSVSSIYVYYALLFLILGRITGFCQFGSPVRSSARRVVSASGRQRVSASEYDDIYPSSNRLTMTRQ